MKYATTALGLIILVFITLGSLAANFNVGNVMVYALGFTLTLWHYLPKRKAVLWLKRVAAAGFAFIFAMMGFIYFSAALNKADYTEDAVIVLGCAVIGDRLSKPLYYRLEKAVEYYSHNPGAVIAVTGGKGPQENLPEGEAMYNYLVARGIPKDKILVESKATSTNENYTFTKALLDKHFKGSAYKCVYITNRFHSYRAGRLAKLNGLEAKSYSARINFLAVLPCYMREVLAVFQLWLLGR